MNNSKNNNNSNRDRGREDARQGRYSPPDGTSWSDIIGQQIFGETQANKDYHEGYKEGKT